jgi:4-hydroxybenzoate polyprenyltransferase
VRGQRPHNPPSAVPPTLGGDEGYGAAALRLGPLVRAMRPLQWTKNSLVLAAPLFGLKLGDLEPVLRSVAAALVFCLVSSAVYLVNDVRDVEADRRHPRKRLRPIAAGELAPGTALRAAAVLFGVGFGGALAVRPAFAALIVGYALLMVLYSWRLKRLVIVDVFAIATGFVMRAAGGALAISVPISPWLYVCTALGALFIGFGKRRNELVTLRADAGHHRVALDHYSLPMLDQIIAVVSSAIVMAYSLYTFDAPAVPDNHAMMLTIPFVLYGLFRYLYLVYGKQLGGSPETILVSDRPLAGCIAGWAATSAIILYLT